MPTHKHAVRAKNRALDFGRNLPRIQEKQHIANPWHSIAIDTIRPWIIPQLPHSSKSKEPTTLQALTIIDLNMHFIKIAVLPNKESITVA
jgi:hypothetical protein